MDPIYCKTYENKLCSQVFARTIGYEGYVYVCGVYPNENMNLTLLGRDCNDSPMRCSACLNTYELPEIDGFIQI